MNMCWRLECRRRFAPYAERAVWERPAAVARWRSRMNNLECNSTFPMGSDAEVQKVTFSAKYITYGKQHLYDWTQRLRNRGRIQIPDELKSKLTLEAVWVTLMLLLNQLKNCRFQTHSVFLLKLNNHSIQIFGTNQLFRATSWASHRFKTQAAQRKKRNHPKVLGGRSPYPRWNKRSGKGTTERWIFQFNWRENTTTSSERGWSQWSLPIRTTWFFCLRLVCWGGGSLGLSMSECCREWGGRDAAGLTGRPRSPLPLYIIPSCISVLAYAMGLTFGWGCKTPDTF